MQIIKKYSRAIGSSNLKDDATHHHTEVLAAVALSGGIGNLLFRVKYYDDKTSFNTLLEHWRDIVKAKASLRNWPLDINRNDVARESLEYWLNDLCLTCKGRGHLPTVEHDRVLEDDDCPACLGTARRPIAVKYLPTKKYVTEMVENLNDMTIAAGCAAISKLSDEARF